MNHRQRSVMLLRMSRRSVGLLHVGWPASLGAARLSRWIVTTALAASLVLSASSVAAQPAVQGERGRAGSPGARAQMERRVEARINDIIRTRLGLSDEQHDQLRAVSKRLESERRNLRREEISTRGELRRHLLAAEPANETRIAELLDQLPRLERRRIDMMEQEQRELARFLAPSQRARYFALQDELRRSLQESQRRRMGPGSDEDGGPSRRRARPPERMEQR